MARFSGAGDSAHISTCGANGRGRGGGGGGGGGRRERIRILAKLLFLVMNVFITRSLATSSFFVSFCDLDLESTNRFFSQG